MKIFCIPASLFACKSGLVDQLDFSQLRLEHVPKEIVKSRKHIQELLLNVNSIEELPPELFRCSKIRRLDVSENKLKMIPPEIGTLNSLEELNLSKNEIVEIPEEIGLCPNLAILDISTNIVTGFPKSFVNLSQLASLNLSNNSLTQLPQDIDRLNNLQFLDVAQCELRSLPASIVRLEQLRVLDLCDNYLTELPADMHGMASLEMLDLHCNMVGRLPEELLHCRSLRNLDLSGNQLTDLPANIGDLANLVELVLDENQIRQLPNSIGQLKRLEVLKASKNCLTELTPSICSCTQLNDLILCENQLNELPASLGNLRRLRFLDVNVNNLQSIPSTIGGCQSLGILSLRHNQLSELPMEIGRLNQLQVLDVADNNMKHLPYTLTVLYQAKSLAALWLSFNQPPLPKLNVTHEPVMNIKVLTCYLLPQKDIPQMRKASSKSCVGGARVCFAGDRREEEEEEKVPIGRFERYDTPHPKPFAPKNRHSRNSGDFSGIVPPQPGSGRVEKGEQQTALPEPFPEPSRPLRSVLKRRPQSVLSHISTSELMPTLLGGAEEKTAGKRLVRKNIQLRRGEDGGFNWTIVGGADSLPYKGKSGLFISSLKPGGVAERAGFRVDDKLLAINGEDLRALGHREACDLIRREGDRLEVLVEREQLGDVNRSIQPQPTPIGQAAPPPALPQRLTFLVARNGTGCVGFSVSGSGKWPEDPFVVAAITSSADCPLMPLDRIVAVGGANLKFGARLDQVKTLLAGMPGTRVEVVVDRGGQWPPPPPPAFRFASTGPQQCSATAFSELTMSRSLPSLLAPLGAGGQAKVGEAGQAVQQQAKVQNVVPAASSSPCQRLFQRQPSLRPTAIALPTPPQPPPRHHRSMSSLFGVDNGANTFGAITTEMLRASTPIEYPPGEEPKIVGTGMGEEEQQGTSSQVSPPRSMAPTPMAMAMGPTRIPLPSSNSTSATSFSAEPSKKSTSSSPPSMPRMSLMEPPLAASSPIPSGKEQQKHSQIPVFTTNPMTTMASSTSNGNGGKTAVLSPPPPMAPKPGKPNDFAFGYANLIPAAAAAEQLTPQPPVVEPQSSMSIGSPPPGASHSFSSKLKHFEQLQTTLSAGGGGVAGARLNGTNNPGGQQQQKPSAIPLKKPLVSAQELEKLREAEEKQRRQQQAMGRVEEDEGEEEEADEHRDTVQELARLLGDQNGSRVDSPSGPSVIRTKKAEMRAERAASATLDGTGSGSGADETGSWSRASSSLSQRAAEIEKRREWRQARLQSMDVESKRTDDLVKLIASATATSMAAPNNNNSPSPIPTGP